MIEDKASAKNTHAARKRQKSEESMKTASNCGNSAAEESGVSVVAIGDIVLLLDTADLPLLKDAKLSIKKGGRAGEPKMYVRCDFSVKSGRPRYAALHRFLVGAPNDCLVDHRNGNPFDNRRANLRVCTPTGNARNRGVNRRKAIPIKGVSAVAGGFRARIKGDGKQIHLGVYPTPEAAGRAYDAAALRLHGDFAWLNFPKEPRHA